MTPLAFIDTETTGLDPDRHEIWEVGLVLRRVDRHEDGFEEFRPDEEYVWQLPVDLSVADPIALNIGHFHDRRWIQGRNGAGVNGKPPAIGGETGKVIDDDDLEDWADRFVTLTRGAHLVGAVISFDERRLWDLLRTEGQCPMWHYHIIDVEALAVGFLRGKHRGLSPEGPLDDRGLIAPPWKSDDLSDALGVKPPGDEDRHTALGDARWARDIYDAVMGRCVPRPEETTP